MVKRRDPKTVATPATVPPGPSPQRSRSCPDATSLRSNDHQIDFAGCPKQDSQAPHSYSRALNQGYSSRSGPGFTCLANIVDQAWVRLLGSLLRTISPKGHGRRQSQEGVRGQGGRKGRRCRRAHITTKVEEGRDYDLPKGPPEAYGSQILPNMCDRAFGGKHEELEHLEAGSLVIFLILLFSPSRVLFVVVGFE